MEGASHRLLAGAVVRIAPRCRYPHGGSRGISSMQTLAAIEIMLAPVGAVSVGDHMNFKRTHFALAVAAMFASTQLAAAQGTSGGTGAIASIPGSVVRGHEQGHGLISIMTDPTPSQPNVSRESATRRRENPALQK